MRFSHSGLIVLSLLLSCAREHPRRVESANLGFAATFPGETHMTPHEELTPFGRIEWFSTSYVPRLRLDESFVVEVGNLPRGDRGGTTTSAVLLTFQRWIEGRLGSLKREDLPAGQGPGFRYLAPGPSGSVVEGVVILRRGRLHHAQATVSKAKDGRLRAFIDGFSVNP
jgi:hypothetical protein